MEVWARVSNPVTLARVAAACVHQTLAQITAPSHESTRGDGRRKDDTGSIALSRAIGGESPYRGSSSATSRLLAGRYSWLRRHTLYVRRVEKVIEEYVAARHAAWETPPRVLLHCDPDRMHLGLFYILGLLTQ